MTITATLQLEILNSGALPGPKCVIKYAMPGLPLPPCFIIASPHRGRSLLPAFDRKNKTELDLYRSTYFLSRLREGPCAVVPSVHANNIGTDRPRIKHIAIVKQKRILMLV